MNYTDEQLSALLDGELSEQETQALRALLAIDADLAARLEELTFADALIRHEYRQIDSRPLPQAVVDLLAAPDSIPSDLNQAHKERLSGNTGGASILQFRSPALLQAAAVLMLAAGILFLTQTFIEPQANHQQIPFLASGPVSLESNLHRLLRDTPSATSRAVGTGSEASFTPILTFKNHFDQYCREFTLADDTASKRSVACLDDGQWSVMLVALDADTIADGEYATAAAINSQGFESYIDTILAQPPLSREQELAAIGDGWRE